MADHPSDIPVTTSSRGASTAVFVSRIEPEVVSTAETGTGPGAGGVDPDHHLWRNGRLWWVAFTVHRGHLQERVRFSLRTDDVVEARRRRDAIFALYASAVDCRISIRLRPRAAAGSERGRCRGRRRRQRRGSGAAEVR